MKKRLLLFAAIVLQCGWCVAQKHIKDSVQLEDVYVVGKSKAQRLREGAITVNAVDIAAKVNTLTNLNDIVNQTTGVKVRYEGGLGSDFELSLNGMSGNSVRYFIDGIPLDTKGIEVTLANIPVNMIDHIEVYKGVVPAYLGSDALGGAINLVTNKRINNFLDASVSAGSFNTYIMDVNGQYKLPKTGILIRPTLGVNFSKNNYKMKDIELWDTERQVFYNTERKRFHDDYLSLLGQIEVGVENRSWADAFFVTASYNKVNKELQTGQIQSIVYGEAEKKQDAWNISARYKKHNFLIPRLQLNVLASHTWNHTLTVDSAYRKYDWNGDWIPTTRNEITGRAAQLRHYKRPLTTLRTNLDYQWNEEHSLNLNYMLYHNGNRRYDDLDREFEPTNDRLTKHIIGLSYNQLLFHERMQNVFFLKEYINHTNIEQEDHSWITNADQVPKVSTKTYTGYGLGTRYRFLEELSLKASFEHTARLPLSREMLGNGTTVYANLALKPENSDNYNIGLFGNIRFGKYHLLNYEIGGFYRHIKDYIHAVLSESEGMIQYDNVAGVNMKGFETELRYSYSDWLQLTTNISYQDARDQNKFKKDGKPSITYNNKVPNRPWLFSNSELTLTKHNITGDGTRLRFSYLYQYVHWFFLTWEGYGSLSTKSRIPTQNLHSATLTYSWQHQRYNLSLECNNIFDTMAFDNFKLQKPGRNILCKFRLFIQ